MLRCIREHDLRVCRSLDGRWDFQPVDEDTCGSPPRDFNDALYVPGAWETHPRCANYRGIAWYRRRIRTPAGNLRLVFGGISHVAVVYLDGQYLGEHHDAYTPFALVAPNVAAGAHVLDVRVDNRLGGSAPLHIANDYYTYGGITRSVEQQIVPDVFIERIESTPTRHGEGWNLDLRVVLQNLASAPQTRELVVLLPGVAEARRVVEVAGSAVETVEISLDALPVSSWSHETPALYGLEVAIREDGGCVDDLRDRIGFREVRVEDGRLLLNGRPIRLKGFNRHEEHPAFGCALPVPAMVQDLELARAMGANFIRTSHYPNDMRFLDLCDEMGFYVWEEAHARNVDVFHPRFRECMEASVREMIAWHRNRPGIIIWGCLNECESDTPEGREEYRFTIDLIRTLDSSRPVTFASNRGERDLCFDLVDIVSMNPYYGWYTGSIDEVEERAAHRIAWARSSDSGGTGKPVIISECGAGAHYGERQMDRRPWSEEYQADVLDENLRVYLHHPHVCGVAIWQFCDTRVTEGCERTTGTAWWRKRPRSMNNKGILDEYRRPKLAYETVRKRFAEAGGPRPEHRD